jgi:hypothetical protein
MASISVRPPGMSDPASQTAAARKAGWRRADLTWEQLQEQANALHCAGDADGASRLWRRAGRIALWRFRLSDPRRATTQANLALAERLAGREDRALKRYAKARLIWRGVDRYIARMRIARASPLHMRMEAKHWDTYVKNTRIRMTTFSRETSHALEALERGAPLRRRLDLRWPTVKPAVFDDTRILLAAALLVAAPINLPDTGRDLG